MYYKHDDTGLCALAEKANALLIQNHQDKEAIGWRVDELVKRAFPIKEQAGVHSISPNEHELYDKEFAAPFMKLKDPEYESGFLYLLGSVHPEMAGFRSRR